MADTITAFHTFSPATKARSSQVNTNFANYRGNLIPIDPNTAASAHLTYDLGTTEYRWRDAYLRGINLIGMTTTSNLTLARDPAVTAGSYLLQIGSTTIQEIRATGVNFLVSGQTVASINSGGFFAPKSWTNTGTVPVNSALVAGVNLASTRIDTSTALTICAARIVGAPNGVIEFELCGGPAGAGGLLFTAPTATGANIQGILTVSRGDTTASLSGIGSATILLRASAQSLTVGLPLSFRVYDTSYTAGEVCYQAVFTTNVLNASGTTVAIAGTMMVRNML